MVWSPHLHSPTDHSGGRVAQLDPHRYGSPRDPRVDDEQETTARLDALSAYLRAWALTEEGSIRTELAQCWTVDSTHVNSFTDTVVGFDGLTNLILDYPGIVPGAALRLTSIPDLHHDVARFSWLLQSTARVRILGRDFGYSVEGLDFVEFDERNRLRRVAVFFGPLIRLPRA